MERVQTVSDADAMTSSGVGSPGPLKFCNFLAKDEPSTGQYTTNGRFDLGSQFGVGGANVEKGDATHWLRRRAETPRSPCSSQQRRSASRQGLDTQNPRRNSRSRAKSWEG